MVTTLYRIIKYGLKNFWRQRLVSLATLTIILLAVLVFQGLIVFNSVSTTVLGNIRDKIDISVYFKTTAPEDEILRVKRSLEGLTEVSMVEYISREDALKTFQEKHKDDATISRAITELGENPLPASLNIKAKDPQKYADIVAYLDSGSFDALVDQISYSENQVIIDKLASIIDVSGKAGFVLTIVIAMVAVIVSFNTILLAIYSNREEITVMRLVGASNSFIRGPFIIEGMIYGIIGTILSLLVSLPIVYTVSPYIRLLSADIDLWRYFLVNFFPLLGLELLFGITIGVVSSVIAIRKYIRI